MNTFHYSTTRVIFMIVLLAVAFAFPSRAQSAPVISEIPDMTIAEGGSFDEINLNDCVNDEDFPDGTLVWDVSDEFTELKVKLTESTAVVTIPDENWYGSEIITFTVTDGTFSDFDDATFTVTPVNDAPVVGDIPDFSIKNGETFAPVLLDNYVTDIDNDLNQLEWSYDDNHDLSVNIDDQHYAHVVADDDWIGSETIVFSVFDGYLSDSDEAIFTVDRLDPEAVDDIYEVDEGGTLSTPASGVLSNDLNADDGSAAAIAVTGPINGSTFNLNADGSFVYSHDGSETTQDAFTYLIETGELQSNVATVTIEVNPVNDSPVIDGLTGETIDEGSTFTDLALSDFASDAETADALLAWAATGQEDLEVSIDEISKIAVITAPSADWNGSESITFTVTDQGSASVSETATFVVNAMADAPVALDDEYSGLPEGGTLNVSTPGILENDSDADGDALLAVLETGPAYSAAFNLNTDGAFTYTHDGSESAEDAFTYRASDGSLTSNLATVRIVLEPVNEKPTLNDISGEWVTFTEDGPAVAFLTGLFVSDPDGGNLNSASVSISANYQSGADDLSVVDDMGLAVTDLGNSLTLIGPAPINDFQTALRSVTFSNSSQNPSTADRTMQVQVFDGELYSDYMYKTVKVDEVNDLPVANNDSYSVAEGGTLNQSAPGVLANDTDPESDPLTAHKVGDPSHGNVTLNTNGSFTYTHNGSETTADAFTYRVYDGTGYSNTVTVYITVTPVNESPTAVNDNYSVAEGGTLNQSAPGVLSNDTDPESDPLTAFEVTGPSNGNVTLNTNGSFTYTHDGSETTADAFTYRASDGFNNSNTATVNITVAPANDPPEVSDIPNQTVAEGASFATINLDGYVTDPDHANNQITWTYSGNSQLSVSIVNRVATITIPTIYWNGAETITFTATDPSGGTDNDLATFTVSSENDPPVVSGIPNQTITEGSTFSTINLDNYIADPDHADNQITWTYSGNSQLSVSIVNRVATITIPSPDWFGTENITFTATDPENGTGSDQASFSVTAVNDPPVLADPSSTPVSFTENGGPVRVTNTITVTDVDNPTLTGATVSITTGFSTAEDVLSYTASGGISGSYNSSTGILSLSGNASPAAYQTVLRSVHYNNTSEAPNTTSRNIAYSVNDASGPGNIINKTVTITGVNDPPVASALVISGANNNIGTVQTASFTFTDPDGDGPGTHTWQWYRSDNAGGTPATAITGATSATYTPVMADGGKYIGFEVTPKDVYELAGTPVRIAGFKLINTAPVASNVQVNAPGTLPGQTLTAQFTYTDAESNPAGAHIYQWYRANSTPTPASPGTPIGSESTYTLRSADAGKYIWFSVNPVATTGSTPGELAWSNIVGPIGNFSANIAGSGAFCTNTIMPITLTVTGGVAPYTATLTRSGSTLNKDTVISNITTTPYVIQVKIAGNYVLKSLTDSNTPTPDIATVTATPVVLTVHPRAKALLSGTVQICDDGSSTAILTANFTAGTAPWKITLRRRENQLYDTTMTGITQDPFNFPGRVILGDITRYRIIDIRDVNDCPGDTASGSVWVSYKTSPTATISGVDTICPGETANLTVTINAGAVLPWSFKYLRDGANLEVVSNIQTYSHTLPVTSAGTYTLASVEDQSCTGKVSGTAYVRQHTIPTAVISGTQTICEHTTTNLTVTLTGSAPWKYSYKLNAGTPVEVPNVTTPTSNFSAYQAGNYTLFEVFDKNCKGTVSGSATLTITPAPEVEMSELAPAYDKTSAEWVLLTGTPTGGNFTGSNGLIHTIDDKWYFVPAIAPVGTNNIVYSYRASPASCYGYDTAVVRVLESNALIEFENNRTKYCLNDGPFTVTGTNILGTIGSFTIEGGSGLYDNGDNTATIKPVELTERNYTITYTYYNQGVPQTEQAYFDIGKSPVADFTWATECFHTEHPIAFSNISKSDFGYLSDTSFIWKIFTSTGYVADSNRHITYTFSKAGNHQMQLTLLNSFGCADTLNTTFALRPTIALADQTYVENFDNDPVGWQSVAFAGTTVNSWELGTPSKHGSPQRGFSEAKSAPNCWFTYLPNTTAPRQQSYVSSPCFDFTGTSQPMLKMQTWQLFNALRDGAALQASSDSGKTWMHVGQINDGINWYNEYSISGMPDGLPSYGWSNARDGYWVDTRHSLDFLIDKPSVQFRIVYGSDGTTVNTDGFAFDDFTIVKRDRTALIEHFTNSSDPDCSPADSIINAFIDQYPNHAVDVQYHTSSPANDPFYEDNSVIPTTRQFYYGLSDVPYAVLNGGTNSQHRFNFATPPDINYILRQSLEHGKFDLAAQSYIDNNILHTDVSVVNKQEFPLMEVSVRIAVVERVIDGITGLNGDTVFRNVVKAMLPGAAGTSIYKSWTVGESSLVKGSWPLQNVYDPAELRVIAFIQNESTKEIYQAALDTIGAGPVNSIDAPFEPEKELSFLVFPNPAQHIAYVRFNAMTHERMTLQLFSNTGRLLYTKAVEAGTPEIELDLEELPNGLYMLRIMSSKKILGISKVVVSK